MALKKEKKKKIVADLKEKIKKQKAIVFVNFTGVKAREMFELRKKLKKENSLLKVAKKKLIQLALKESDIDLGVENFEGEIGLVFGFADEIFPAKLVYQFSKENPRLKIVGGIFGKKFYDERETIELAQLPSKEELLARILSALSAPILNFENVLIGNLRNFVFLLSQVKGRQ